MIHTGTTGFGVELLTCSACSSTDTVTVKYTCPLCSHSEVLPPKPDGHPMHRRCPDPAESGCTGQETGVVVSCSKCTDGTLSSR